MRTPVIAVLICVWSTSAPVSGQAPTKVGPGAGAAVGAGTDILFSEPLDIAAAVIGRPYSADTLTVTTQVLADGNRIERHG